MNLQDMAIEDWKAASDEEIVSELLRSKKFVNPSFMSYIKNERNNCLRAYLNIHKERGGYVSGIAWKAADNG